MRDAREVHGGGGLGTEVKFGDTTYRLPFFYHDNDGFMTLHTASYDAVRAEIPSDLIEPLRWADGRALVAVTAFRYNVTTWCATDGSTHRITPYGEVSVAAVVTRGHARRVLPLLSGERRGFILHLPLTTSGACDVGIEIWGLPKFVADIDFIEERAARRFELSEGGSTILRLAIEPAGPVVADRRPLVLYSSRRGQLLETVMPVRAHVQLRMGGRAGQLALGPHPVGERLRQLEISPRPVMAFNYIRHRTIMPLGTPIGPARPYEGYAGTRGENGRYTVAYPGTAPLDQYASVRAPSLR